MTNPLIAPSILSADFLNLASELGVAESCQADWHHIDVMDGHFVPQLTLGAPLVKMIKAKSKIFVDVHIMVSNPDLVARDYLDAGADLLTFHIEAATHVHRLCQQIKEAKCKVGIALNPGTPLSSLDSIFDMVDVVMLMSVNPGFGGQKYIPSTTSKIQTLLHELKRRNLHEKVMIEVDGGINRDTIKEAFSAGAQAFVAGNAFYGAADRKKAMDDLRLACKG
ncbi:MAG: ribulose-phosphate 3-epimerase [Pseudomonadota bacterium]